MSTRFHFRQQSEIGALYVLVPETGYLDQLLPLDAFKGDLWEYHHDMQRKRDYDVQEEMTGHTVLRGALNPPLEGTGAIGEYYASEAGKIFGPKNAEGWGPARAPLKFYGKITKHWVYGSGSGPAKDTLREPDEITLKALIVPNFRSMLEQRIVPSGDSLEGGVRIKSRRAQVHSGFLYQDMLYIFDDPMFYGAWIKGNTDPPDDFRTFSTHDSLPTFRIGILTGDSATVMLGGVLPGAPHPAIFIHNDHINSMQTIPGGSDYFQYADGEHGGVAGYFYNILISTDPDDPRFGGV